MHPLISYDLARIRVAELHAEADHERLVRIAHEARRKPAEDGLVQPRWSLRRLFARLNLAGSGA